MSLSHKYEIMDELCLVLDAEHAEAIMEHRRVTIKKPLTKMAAKLLAKRLAEWGDANDAAEIMIERAWQGFDKSWIKDRRAPFAGRQTPSSVMGDVASQLRAQQDERFNTDSGSLGTGPRLIHSSAGR